MKKIILVFLFLIIFCVQVKANTQKRAIFINHNQKNEKLYDQNENTYVSLKKEDQITIKAHDIEGIYIIYKEKSNLGILKNEKQSITIGENQFLHEYINVRDKIGKSNELTLQYETPTNISEIVVLSEGDSLLDDIEIWNPPHEKADLLLFSTHSDDELLFFAGLIPKYIALGKNVQIVYFTHHGNHSERFHEALHGLYTVGVRNYPLFGIVPDEKSYSLEGAIEKLEKNNLTLEKLLQFQTEMIRRFKPLVVVGHDENGEYKHGQHLLNTYVLKQALEKAKEKDYDKETIQKYGVWDVPKTYLHSYKENEIVLDFDVPLEYYNGKTAYEVSKEGFKKHKSQVNKRFYQWIYHENFKKASEIQKYSPTKYGLYRTTVGFDVEKKDMFEHIEIAKNVQKNSFNCFSIYTTLLLVVFFIFKSIKNKKQDKKRALDL